MQTRDEGHRVGGVSKQRALDVAGCHKLPVSQKSRVAAKKANIPLACINRHLACEKCEVILPSCSTWIVPQLEYGR